MKRGHFIWAGVASAALLMAACSTTEEAAKTPADRGGSSSSGEVTPPAPPPPPPAPVASSDVSGSYGSSELAVTGSRTESLSRPAPTSPPIIGPVDPRPQPEPQSGLLTAGDYDDVLNPDLYKAYLDKTLQTDNGIGRKDLPYVDAANRIAVRITDRLGKPVPFANVDVDGPEGEDKLTLRTGANGLVYLYPAFDELENGTVVSVSLPGAETLQQVISLNDVSGGGELAFVMNRDAPKVQKLDILLTIDATGSMTDEMRYLQTEMTSIMTRMEGNNPDLDIHAGLIVYRDRGDEYVVRDFDFTGDLAAFKETIAAQGADGGGDFPEAMHTAMNAGLGLTWRKDAIKVNLLVADAPPHDQDISATWGSALRARAEGIHTVPLAASGVDPTAEFLMRAMGQITGGRYLFLTDDSGVGNPHAEPTVDCYVVTPLNGLVQRVLESLVSGVRVEPDGDSVVRTVGNYQAGVCKLEAPKKKPEQ